MNHLLILLCAGMALAAVSDYQSEIAAWRANRVAKLTSETGWTTVAGLFWLHEGANSFGKAAGSDIVLMDGPEHAGVFEFHNGQVTVRLTGDAGARAVAADSDDVVRVGRLKLFVIQRGDRFGIRLRDPESDYRRHFHGIQFYPANEKYRVTAKWVAAPRTIPVLSIIGNTDQSENPGYAVFHLGGKELRLYPIFEEPGAKELFYIFRDLTTGKETYPSGRFLYSELPKNGEVVLDFNKAYNPPCAFTPFATCPLPPKENSLSVRVEAGEKTYHIE